VGAMTDLLVSEIFGPTIQGEGPLAGHPATFVRLGLCNLQCGVGAGATWACDTPYTWDWKGLLGTPHNRSVELRHVGVDDLVDQARGWTPDVVVVTGGEPMVQWKNLRGFLEATVQFKTVQIETNGTLVPPVRAGALWVVSPKTANSGEDTLESIDFLAWRLLDAQFKFVCATGLDVAAIHDVCTRERIAPREVWIMPAGTSPEALQASLAAILPVAAEWGFKVSGRLHVSAFGNRRGV